MAHEITDEERARMREMADTEGAYKPFALLPDEEDDDDQATFEDFDGDDGLRADGGVSFAGPADAPPETYQRALARVQRVAPNDEVGNGVAALADAVASEDWEQVEDAAIHLISKARKRRVDDRRASR